MKSSPEFCFDLALIGAMLLPNLISVATNYRGKGHSCTESITLLKIYWHHIILTLTFVEIQMKTRINYQNIPDLPFV